MERGSLTKLIKGKAIGAQKGFVDSFNFLIDFVKSLNDGYRINVTWKGALCKIDRDDPEEGEEGGGGTPTPPEPVDIKPFYEDPALSFNIVRNASGAIDHIGNCDYFLNGHGELFDIPINGAGIYGLKMVRDYWGGYSVDNAKDDDSKDLGEYYDDEQILTFPLYKIGLGTSGYTVERDYVHGMPNLFYLNTTAILGIDGDNYNDRYVSSVDWVDEKTLKKTLRVHSYRFVPFYNPANGNEPTLSNDKVETILTAEVYEDA